MAGLPDWKISFLKRQDGTDPFSDFASRLPTSSRIEWEAIIRLLQRFGNTLQGNRVLVHKNELYEFTGDEVRVFYKCVGTDEVCIIGALRTSDSDELARRIIMRG